MELSVDRNLNNDKQKPKDLGEVLRRQCGCLRTSEKLQQILKTFPSPPPPSPLRSNVMQTNKTPFQGTCISSYCTNHQQPFESPTFLGNETMLKKLTDDTTETIIKKESGSRVWGLVMELVQIVQLSVTATALALYYVIYCYMQLVYYTLRTALYFHNADGPMKITIGVVTLTSIIIGFHVILRLERLLEIFLFNQ